MTAWSASLKGMFEIKLIGSEEPRFAGLKNAEDGGLGDEKWLKILQFEPVDLSGDRGQLTGRALLPPNRIKSQTARLLRQIGARG